MRKTRPAQETRSGFRLSKIAPQLGAAARVIFFFGMTFLARASIVFCHGGCLLPLQRLMVLLLFCNIINLYRG